MTRPAHIASSMMVLALMLFLGCTEQGEAIIGGDDAMDADRGSDRDTSLARCQGVTVFDYDPLMMRHLGAFPDDVHTRLTSETRTGREIAFQAGFAEYLASQEEAVALIYGHLQGLDGWGIAAPAMIRFTGDISAINTTMPGAPDDTIQLWNIDAATPHQVPIEVKRTDSAQVLMIWPLLPLAPAQRHSLIVTRRYPDANGDCIAPGDTLSRLLDGVETAPELQEVQQSILATLTAAALDPNDISALTTFTTQTTLAPTQAVMAEIEAAPITWSTDAVCVVEDDELVCERRFVATDFRMTSPGRASWELVMTAWIPLTGDGPFPTMVFGHGINSDRRMADEAVDALRGLGVVVVSVDAVAHGDHPTSEGLSGYEGVLTLLGIDAMAIEVDGRKMRDNFLQSSFDKLQLIELIKRDGDLDQDGLNDVDPDALGYIGLSLGAIMGSQVLALSKDMKVSALVTPGARLTDILAYADRMSMVLTVLDGITGSRDATLEALSAVQTATDPGDAVAFAGHVLRDRLNDAPAPHILAMQVIDDNTVPATTTRALTWALGLPQMTPVVEPIPMVEQLGGPIVQANLNNGDVTGALFQFDRVHRNGELVIADHDSAGRAEEIVWQLRTFIESWIQSETPRIEDPYAALGTPRLEQP